MTSKRRKSDEVEECDRCSGKGVEGDSYDNRKPDYVSSNVEYGQLTMTDDRGKAWTVQRDETGQAAIERLEAKRDQLHFEVDLRIDALVAAVRRWDAGRPYPEKPDCTSDLPECFEHYHVGKARRCADFLRPLLATWQYAQEVKHKADSAGFKPNTIERARQLLKVEIENRDRRSFWRLPDPPAGAPTWAELEQMNEDDLTGIVDLYGLGTDLPAEEFGSIDELRDWVAVQLNIRKPAATSDFRTFDHTVSEVRSSEAAER